MLFESCKSLEPKKAFQLGMQGLRTLWPDEISFLAKTIWITRKKGPPCLLVPNDAQRRFYREVVQFCENEGRPVRGIILKARQLGFSTFIQALHYVKCVLNQHRFALTVSYDVPSTVELFAKASFAHGRMWFPLPTQFHSTKKIEFKEPFGSKFHAITSGNENIGRSYTFHHVHCSEIPMWQDAETTLAGLGEAIPSGLDTTVFWESTARGLGNIFYEAWKDAESGSSDFIPFFAPWFEDPTYSTEFPSDDHLNRFMRSLSVEDRKFQEAYQLTPQQMQWRDLKIRSPNMTRALFKQEYPSCAEEAFLTSGAPVFDPETIVDMLQHTKDPVRRCDIVLEAS